MPSLLPDPQYRIFVCFRESDDCARGFVTWKSSPAPSAAHALDDNLQIGYLLAADIPNVILGILNHMFLGDAVKTYQNQDKPKSK